MIEEALKGLLAGTARSADLKRFEHDAFETGGSPPIKRRCVDLFAASTTRKNSGCGREGQKFFFKQLPLGV